MEHAPNVILPAVKANVAKKVNESKVHAADLSFVLISTAVKNVVKLRWGAIRPKNGFS